MLKVQLQLSCSRHTVRQLIVRTKNILYCLLIVRTKNILILTVQTQTGFAVFEMKHYTHNFGRFDDEVNQNLS
jgi:hypothetical protein